MADGKELAKHDCHNRQGGGTKRRNSGSKTGNGVEQGVENKG